VRGLRVYDDVSVFALYFGEITSDISLWGLTVACLCLSGTITFPNGKNFVSVTMNIWANDASPISSLSDCLGQTPTATRQEVSTIGPFRLGSREKSTSFKWRVLRKKEELNKAPQRTKGGQADN